MSASPHIPSRLVVNNGWRNCANSRFLRSTNWQSAPEFQRHGHALRRLFEDIAAEGVLCVEGRPSVCVLNGRSFSAHEIEDQRRRLWNLGATTLLLVERAHDVQVFSTMSKPSRDDLTGAAAQLADETIDSLQAVELALSLRGLIRRIETGAIYREHKLLFTTESAVDHDLLENLKTARELICPERSKEGYQRAHALIGRFLFCCYLLDRGIIGPPYLRRKGLPEATDMVGLMRGALLKAPVLEKLFDALHRDFNGSLFGDPFSSGTVREEEITWLIRLLAGENLRTGQLSMFKLYNFSFIPVELISSIYEEFLSAESAAEALDDPNITDGQRQHGAYYTPHRLAELTVDIATEGWSTLLDKRCLDPACGSGIFLVILFVRMAEEWRKRYPHASTLKRYEGLMKLLGNNLQGIDIQLTACLVSCFSLYLAFLDQMEPKEVMELRDALERDTREKLLPRILWESEKPRPKGRNFAGVREADFFELEHEAEFDLVIGNPPWVSRKPAPSAETWLFAKHLVWTKEEEKTMTALSQTLFPAKELACAFMWKASLHLKSAGRVCQVLPSRVFLSNNTDRFQAAWLLRHKLEAVWLLADYRFILFPTAICPCFIARYHPRIPGEDLGEFTFISPKVELLDPRQAKISVMPEDQRRLHEAEIVSAAKREEAAAAWKKYHWGTPRDVRLVERLTKLPKLSRLAKAPPRNVEDLPARRSGVWYKGQGFQPATDSTENPHDVFWDSEDRFLPATAAISDLILLRNDTIQIGDLYRDVGLHRKRNPILYEAPLLLLNKGCTKFVFCSFDVLFQDDFQSICAPKSDEDELLFLTAVFASPLAQYLLFHTTANIGIERDIARLEEMLELPFPLPDEMPHPRESRRIVKRCSDLLRSLKEELSRPQNLLRRDALVANAKERLNELVYKYFDLSDWERQLVKDTVEVFRPSATPTSAYAETLATAQPSTHTQRAEYAETLAETFRGWSRNQNLSTYGCTAPQSKLAVLTLRMNGTPSPYQETVMEERVETIIASIREHCASAEATFQCLRGFAFYEADRVHILKPLNRRHWTRTAALNDADEILSRMMEEGGWD